MDGSRHGVRGGPDAAVVPAHVGGPGGGLGGVRALIVRVVAAGRTGPNTALRFGSEVRRLDETGLRDCARLVSARGAAEEDVRRYVGPEASAIDTAALLGIDVPPDQGLRSLDVGRWRGRLPEDIPQAQLGDWLRDVTATPHGGESIASFVARIASWLDTVARRDCDDGDGSDGPRTVTVVASMPVVQAIVTVVEHDDAQQFFTCAVAPGTERVLQIMPLDSGDDRCHPG